MKAGWAATAATAMLLAGGAMAADVHLGKAFLHAGDPWPWRGMALGEVVDEAQIERVILLRAVTSAPADLDLRNLRRLLVDSAAMPLTLPSRPPPAPWQARESVWSAVLLMRDGRVFELEVLADGAQLHGCLGADDGARGCFDVPPRDPPA